MNVDILSNDPSWIWYIVFAVPFMVFVLLAWILFKYIPVGGHTTYDARIQVLTFSQIGKWIEDNIGSRLERKPVAPDTVESSSSGAMVPVPDIEHGMRNRRTNSQ